MNAVPEVTVPRYAAPTVTSTPVTEVILQTSLGEWGPGHYQSVLLDTATGEHLPTAMGRNAQRPYIHDQHAQLALAQHNPLGLQAEGFTAVFHTSRLPLMAALLRRAADREQQHPALAVERAFGPALADLFTWRGPDADGLPSGAFALGGQELTVRWREPADDQDGGYETPTTCRTCARPAWTPVNTAQQLLNAFTGDVLHRTHCAHCD
ncbi:hypothetical protein [Kitasatospora griseola]|uniref:hypothetical protein n=1 Tax=Kitasatospora griseola TaxID=2064 RepID=UPI0034300D59